MLKHGGQPPSHSNLVQQDTQHISASTAGKITVCEAVKLKLVPMMGVQLLAGRQRWKGHGRHNHKKEKVSFEHTGLQLADLLFRIAHQSRHVSLINRHDGTVAARGGQYTLAALCFTTIPSKCLSWLEN